jgi:hypothetical protein
MPEGEHSGKGEAEGGTPKRRMVVRWGRAHFEDIEPGDPDHLDTDAAAEGDPQPEGNQPSPEPGAGPATERRRTGGERRLDVLRRQRRLKLAVVLLVAIDAVLLVDRFTVSDDPFLLTTPPPSILGTWVTEDPVYSGTAFVISDEVFELRLSEGGNNRFWIRSIRGVETEDSWRFEITYTSPEEGDLEHIFFLYADGTARLNNPPDVVWTRL